MSQFKKYMNLINEMKISENPMLKPSSVKEMNKQNPNFKLSDEYIITQLRLDDYVKPENYYSIIPFYRDFISKKDIPDWNKIRNVIWNLFPSQRSNIKNKTFYELKKLIKLSYLKYLEDKKASDEELKIIIKGTMMKKTDKEEKRLNDMGYEKLLKISKKKIEKIINDGNISLIA